ncbi:MAG: hypothetical protein HY270_05025, partial [Deltaproteobacteria bacterium]|nr:hypothetical protein [Deltaproteobacteria bacterium]
MHRSPELFSPEGSALLDWMVESLAAGQAFFGGDLDHVRRLNGTALRSLLDGFSNSSLVSWGDDLPADPATRAGLVPGAPLRAERVPASLVPTVDSRDGHLRVELAFVWPDGRKVPLRDALYLRESFEYGRVHPSFVICGGVISPIAQEPPLALVERIAAIGFVPVGRSERTQLLGLLAAQFGSVRQDLTTHTRWHSLQSLAVLDLRNDDWLQIRIFGRTRREWIPGRPVAPGEVAFELAADGRWIQCQSGEDATLDAARPDGEPDDIGPVESIAEATTEPDTRPVPVDGGDVWFEAPDPESVQPAIDWLGLTQATTGTKARSVGLTWPDCDRGFWLKLRRRGVDLLAAAWDERPPGMAFFGTAKVRRLLTGELRVTPRLQIQSSGVDWFSVSADWEVQGLELSEEDLAALRNATSRYVKLSSGWVRRDAADVYDEAALVLADLGIEPDAGDQRLSVWQLAGAKSESLATLKKLGVDRETLAAVERLRSAVADFEGLPRINRPDGLIGDLRPYQERGVDFLTQTSSLGLGAVLADDMGLGKTVQALTWLLHQRQVDPDGGPVLVVCPASVVHNWHREAERFAPGLRI